ncbi:hypothetical protein B0H13DRAFT_1891781 [Mycena leptocephala]|nr:hypothetical protein B0H13DRAFT_1891781 [Mycena leptocephala]
MSPPKPTHPLAHLPDPPQNYIPCAPTKYWPSTMDEEQHSSQGNKWWWLVYLGPMQGAYATRATAVANVPSASKIENAIEYFDTLTDLNHGWKKSCFHWQGHCPVHFACASVCHHLKPTPAVRTDRRAIASARNFVRAAQRTATRVPNDSAGSISGVPHARHIAPLTPHDTASSISRIPLRPRWRSIWWILTDKNSSACVHPPPPQPQRFFARHAVPFYPHSTPSRPSPPSSPPAYSPPSWSLSPLVATRQKPCPDPAPSWEFSMSMGGKANTINHACLPVTTLGLCPEPDCSVKTEPKPYAKTEPEPRIKLKSGVKQEVKLKLNLQHDVERSCSRSHVPVPLHDPDSESDESMDKFKAMQRKLRQLAKNKSVSTKLPPTVRGGRSGPL